MNTEKDMLLGVGNVYIETIYHSMNTGGKDILEAGKEYAAPHYEMRLGGSVVNFLIQARLLGCKVQLIGKTGQDEYSEKLRKFLADAGIADDLVVASPDVQTNIDAGFILEHSGESIQGVAGNANQRLSLKDIDLDSPVFERVSAVYLGGGLKQEALFPDYPELINSLNARGIKVFLDHNRFPPDTNKEKVDILTRSLSLVEGYFPNDREILEFVGTEDLDLALEKVIKMGPKLVVVKLGADGCRVKTMDEDFHIPGHKVAVVSTVGAGDSFNAGFISQYLSDKSLEECARFANAAAALRVRDNDFHTSEEINKFLQVANQ